MPPRRVASKHALRVTAWASAAATLVGSGAVLGWLPKPEPVVALEPPRPRKVLVVRKQIVRRVIVEERAAPVASSPAVTYVRAPSTASSPPAATSTGGS
jgi:hypothetical protein